jgi:hypothetical protein
MDHPPASVPLVAQVGGQCLLPGAETDAQGAGAVVVSKNRSGRRSGVAAELVQRDRAHRHVVPACEAQYLPGELETGARSLIDQMVNAKAFGGDQLTDGFGQIGSVRGCTELVIHHGQFGALLA